jgi:hypothetical protein
MQSVTNVVYDGQELKLPSPRDWLSLCAIGFEGSYTAESTESISQPHNLLPVYNF